jgi:hypothetical protein
MSVYLQHFPVLNGHDIQGILSISFYFIRNLRTAHTFLQLVVVKGEYWMQNGNVKSNSGYFRTIQYQTCEHSNVFNSEEVLNPNNLHNGLLHLGGDS